MQLEEANFKSAIFFSFKEEDSELFDWKKQKNRNMKETSALQRISFYNAFIARQGKKDS